MTAKNPMRRSWLDETNGGWVAIRLELVLSPAWQGRPVPVMRLLDRIEIEHMRHGGKENGRLLVSVDQFVDYGVSRKMVKPSIDAAVGLGLLRCIQSDEMISNVKSPNAYRLTYLPERDKRAPTDEWATVTRDQVKAVAEAFRDISGRKSKATGQFPFTPSPSSLSAAKSPSPSSLSAPSLVPHREQSLISGGYPHSTAVSAEEAHAPKAMGARRSGQPQVTAGEALRGTAIFAKLSGAA